MTTTRALSLLSYVAIGCMAVTTAIKNNSESLLTSEVWGGYSDYPLVASLKALSTPALVAATAILVLTAVLRLRTISPIGYVTSTILAANLYIALRSFLVVPDLSVKYVWSAFLIGVLFVVMSQNRRWNPMMAIQRDLFNTMVGVGLVVTGANFLNVMTGNGFVVGFPRLIGVGGHPNFTGVQLAIAALFFLAGGISQRGAARLVCLCGCAAALYMVYLTGSRTALLVFGTSAVTYFWALSGFSKSRLLIGVLCLAALALFWLQSGIGGPTSDAFDRGGGSTRSGTLAYLLGSISENPFLGLGYFAGLSENSLLRAWAAFGMLTPMLLLAWIILLTRKLYRRCRQTGYSFESCTFLGCVIGLWVGSALEGYLVDSFSFPLLIGMILSVWADLPLGIPHRSSRSQGHIVRRLGHV